MIESPARPRRFVAPLLATLAIALCALLLMWRPVVAGEVFLPIDALLHLHPWRYSYERVPVNNPRNTDPIRQTYPRRVLTNAMVEQGALPLWNPSIITGTPLLDDGQLAFFYPPSLLFLALPFAPASAYYTLLHLIIAGTGAFCFARHLRLSYGAATLAGVCYLFSGYMLTWLQFPHHTAATAILPWCFWAVGRACAARGWYAWVPAAAILAVPILTQLQLAFYIYVGVGVYVLLRVAQAESWRARLSMLVGFSAAIALALALSAVQLVPAVDLSAGGQRQDFDFTSTTSDYQFTMLLRLVFPALEGEARIGPPPAWGPAMLQLPYPYVGLLPLLLGLVVLARSDHRESWFFGLAALTSFALGVSSTLVKLFMLLVPPYRQFEDHTRWFVLWGFAVAVLAAMGADALRSRAATTEPGARRVLRANRVLLVLLLGLLGAWGLYHLQLFTPQSRYGIYITLIRQQALLPTLLFGLAGLAALALLWFKRVPAALGWTALIAVAAGDVLWFNGNFNTSTNMAIVQPTSDLLKELETYPAPAQAEELLYPPTRQIAFLQRQPGPFRIHGADPTTLPPNIAGTFGLEDIRGYHSLFTERYSRLARLIDGKDYARGSEGKATLRPYFTSAYEKRRLLNMLNVEYLIFPPENTSNDAYAPLELVHQSDEGRIYRNPQALPRAWLVHQVEVIPDDEAQLDRLARSDFDPATTAIIPEAVPQLGPPAPAPTPTVSYAPNQVVVRAETPSAALLVLADAFHDGWRVTVDGQDAPLYRANYALRGVWLPAGTHTVVFTFRPVTYIVGGVISAAALLLIIGASIVQWRRRVEKPVENVP